MSGLYIHIPFCESRCIYCGFYSTTLLNKRQRYVDALCHEMSLRPHPTLSTIYIGGGTPSQLTPSQLNQLFTGISTNYPPLPANVEVTMECNPDDITKEYAEVLSSLPINRVSMGVQTFSDKRLHFLHRRHTSSQAMQAVDILREAGIQNISIDLMFGFPDETISEWESDIESALSLNVEHISAYSLMYEEGTPLYDMLKKGQISEIDEERYIIMYKTLVNHLESSGYRHYEISNFALEGYESRHNSSYWNGTPYIGIGAAACSYDILSRKNNIADIDKYMESIEKGETAYEEETLSATDRYNDLITTALRTHDGINLETLEREHGIEAKNYLLQNAQRHIDSGMLAMESGMLHLTLDGIMVSDNVMSDLIKI